MFEERDMCKFRFFEFEKIHFQSFLDYLRNANFLAPIVKNALHHTLVLGKEKLGAEAGMEATMEDINHGATITGTMEDKFAKSLPNLTEK